jgi:predicted metal-dependent hydrolase
VLDTPATNQLQLWSEGESSGDWIVRESRRARRLSVRVMLSGRVEVVVPPGTPARAVERFVSTHRDWIERKRADLKRSAMPPDPFPPERVVFGGGAEVWRVHVAGGARRRVRAVPISHGLLSLEGAAQSPREVHRAMRDWLIDYARVRLGEALAACARDMNARYQRLSIRRQRTRWGSCSVHGTISLNCCLLFQRSEVVRYLLVHELAHTRHMNHSRRFWSAVAEYCVDYRSLDRELLDGWRRVPSWVFGD